MRSSEPVCSIRAGCPTAPAPSCAAFVPWRRRFGRGAGREAMAGGGHGARRRRRGRPGCGRPGRLVLDGGSRCRVPSRRVGGRRRVPQGARCLGGAVAQPRRRRGHRRAGPAPTAATASDPVRGRPAWWIRRRTVRVGAGSTRRARSLAGVVGVRLAGPPRRPASALSSSSRWTRPRMSAMPEGGTAKESPALVQQRVEELVVEHRHRQASTESSTAAVGRPAVTMARVVGQAAAGLVQAGLDRALPATDGQGDVALAQVGVVAQHDRHPQGDREPLQRGQHGLGHLGPLGARGGVAVARHALGQLAVAGPAIAMGDLLAQLRVAGVHDDAVEPGLDARDRRQRVTKAPGAQERLLDRLFGVGPVAQDEAGGAEGDRVPLLEPVFEPFFHHPPL